MAHIVTCQYCRKKFDRDKIPFVQISPKRYAHKDCSKKEDARLKQEEADKIDLENYIMKLLGEDYISPRVRKQINTYREQYQYTFSGMKKALVYFYEVKGNSTEKANGGIGILEYIWDEVENYYTKKADIKKHNLEVNEKDLFEPKVFTFRIKEEPVKKPKRVKLFSIK